MKVIEVILYIVFFVEYEDEVGILFIVNGIILGV